MNFEELARYFGSSPQNGDQYFEGNLTSALSGVTPSELALKFYALFLAYNYQSIEVEAELLEEAYRQNKDIFEGDHDVGLRAAVGINMSRHLVQKATRTAIVDDQITYLEESIKILQLVKKIFDDQGVKFFSMERALPVLGAQQEMKGSFLTYGANNTVVSRVNIPFRYLFAHASELAEKLLGLDRPEEAKSYRLMARQALQEGLDFFGETNDACGMNLEIACYLDAALDDEISSADKQKALMKIGSFAERVPLNDNLMPAKKMEWLLAAKCIEICLMKSLDRDVENLMHEAQEIAKNFGEVVKLIPDYIHINTIYKKAFPGDLFQDLIAAIESGFVADGVTVKLSASSKHQPH